MMSALTNNISPLDVRVHRSWDEAHVVFPEWDELAMRVGGCVYLSPIHAEIWWNHYGRGSLLIVECRIAKCLVGIFPLFITPFIEGIIPVRVAKFLASDSILAVLTPPVAQEYSQICWKAAINAALEDGAEVIAFTSLSGEGNIAEDVRNATSAMRMRVIEDHLVIPHTIYKLPSTIDEYFASLDSKARGNMKRPKRNLIELGKFEIQIFKDEEAPKALDRFIRFHTERWNAEGQLGHFGDWPKSNKYTMDVVRALSQRGEALLFELTLDGRLIGAEFALTYGSRAFDRLPARLTGEEWDKIGLGSVIQLVLFETMLSLNIRHIESGQGHYPYKLRAGGNEYSLINLVVCRSDLRAIFKAYLSKACSKLLHYGYYRGWRVYILQHFGIMPKPLWRIWIQSRL